MVRQLIVSFVLAILAAVFVRTFLLQTFRVPSGSMEPNLQVGDHILVNIFLYGGERWSGNSKWRAPGWLPMRAPRRGEVAVFRFPSDLKQRYVKRCLGRPGEHIEGIGSAVTINGQPVAEPYLDASRPAGTSFGAQRVPARSYFFLGDHRGRSSDSRRWGAVPAQRLGGRAILVYWSTAPPSVNGKEWSIMSRWLGKLSRSRWQRCLRWVT